jgi:glycosyltransferase involved in cell wall biosynthesis
VAGTATIVDVLVVDRTVLMALQFWPRGGSAQVVRYLAPEIVAAGWRLSLVSGSVGASGDLGYAPEFFWPLPVRVVDYTQAMELWRSGGDPFSVDVPLQPSFEDRRGAPDRVFASLDDADFERQVSAWSHALQDAGLAQVGLAHLHHLTPVNEAVKRLRPELPLVVSLHGTELAMLEAIEGPGSGAGPPAWPHAAAWAARLRGWAGTADRLVVTSPTDAARAVAVLGVAGDRVVVEPPGVDQERFRPVMATRADRLHLLRSWLVEQPRGWDESGVVGSVRYRDADLAVFGDEEQPVLIFVGRFTLPKRLPLLLRAYGRARRDFGLRAPLLVWGGFPGEWEGEHPVTVVRDEGIDGVFFTGWRGHEDLPTGLGCADVFVSPSVGEAFGQVFVEAMACGLPVVAAASGGPLSFVNSVVGAPNGWLVPPDNADALTTVLVEVTSPSSGAVQRAVRSANAQAQVTQRFSWTATARHMVGHYESVTTKSDGRS